MAVIMSSTGHPWTKFYEEAVPATLDYPDLTLGNMLSRTAAAFPDRPALLFYGKRVNYAELDGMASSFARALIRLGVRKGQRVALMLPNVPQMVIAYYGTLRAGAIAVPTNPLYHAHELEVQLRDSGAGTLVALDQFYPVISPVLAASSVKHLILCRVQDFLPFPKNLLYPIKSRLEKQYVSVKREGMIHDFTDLVKREEGAGFDDRALPGDIALLQYTGGTTGIPKGAVLTHRNLVVNAVQSRAWLTLRNEGEAIILAAIPFFHVYGMTTAMNLGILIGAALLLLPKFHTKEVLKVIEQKHPQIFPGIQAMYLAIANSPKVRDYDLSSLQVAISGAGPLMRDVQERFEKLTGARIVEGYGLSEASPVTHANPIFGRRKVGSIGLPWPDVEARIVDVETGKKTLPPGETGELVVRGPQVMKEYWNRPQETAEALRDGWLHTGDIAMMDEEGYFFIVDRIKDMIKTVGENVYPREVEEVLFSHPKVKEAVVVGIPQEFLGEEIKAYIVLKDGFTATAQEIIDYCGEQLSKFKVPKEVEFRKELPKTLVGKVLRRVLKDEELKKIEARPTGQK
jgi:long-chain acyl-CoA synthetase